MILQSGASCSPLDSATVSPQVASKTSTGTSAHRPEVVASITNNAVMTSPVADANNVNTARPLTPPPCAKPPPPLAAVMQGMCCLFSGRWETALMPVVRCGQRDGINAVLGIGG